MKKRMIKFCIVIFIIFSCVMTTSSSLATVPKNYVIGLGNNRSYTAFALKKDGTVWAWGDDSNGELGNGKEWIGGKRVYSNLPIKVSSISDVVDLSGNDTVLAVKKDGTVWGWGSVMYSGTLAPTNSNGFSQFKPIQIKGISNVKRVSAGGTISVALKKDGTVWVWGSNQRGEYGNGTSTGPLTEMIHMNLNMD